MARKTLLVCDRCEAKLETTGSTIAGNWGCTFSMPLVGLSGYNGKHMDLCQDCQTKIMTELGLEPKTRKKKVKDGLDRTATPVG